MISINDKFTATPPYIFTNILGVSRKLTVAIRDFSFQQFRSNNNALKLINKYLD